MLGSAGVRGELAEKVGVCEKLAKAECLGAVTSFVGSCRKPLGREEWRT